MRLSDLQSAGVSEAGMLPLLHFMDFSISASIVIMTAGGGDAQACFERASIQVRTNSLPAGDWAHSHLDAMQPLSYATIKQAVGMHAIILTPVPELIDAMLPIAMRYARHVVCCYMPVMYLRHAHTLRVQFMMHLQAQGRLKLIPGAVRGDRQTACIWLLVFPTRFQANLMVTTQTECVCDLLP
jgi:hypothetical protein